MPDKTKDPVGTGANTDQEASWLSTAWNDVKTFFTCQACSDKNEGLDDATIKDHQDIKTLGSNSD